MSTSAPPPADAGPAAGAPQTGPGPVLHGTPVTPGVAYAPVVVPAGQVPPEAVAALRERELEESEAMAAYDAAVTAVAARFERRASLAEGQTAQVLTATARLVRDRSLRAGVVKRVRAGDHLLTAIEAATDQFAGLLSRLGGPMAERVADLRDVEGRIVATLVGEPEPGVPVPDRPSVLAAENLAPADTAGLDPALVVALVTERGGPTSHTAVVARQLGIPCVVAVPGVASLAAGTPVLVDGATGEVAAAPDPAEASARVAVDAAARAAAAVWRGPGRTRDGAPVALLANVSDLASARRAADAPVEGTGLYRTELAFLDRSEEPDVAEQVDRYAEVLAVFGPERTVVVRTLDAGSDKPLPFIGLPEEENPALGLRGLRAFRDDPGPLERQVEALALAAERTGTEPWVMAPMVATVSEASAFATLARGHGLRAGVVVEVPGAALLADRILEEVDFLSVGTNDLAQYTLAADRADAGLAHLADAWQPAVLRLVATTADAGRRTGKPVGVCGEAAGDPELAVVLVGLGVTSLSMASGAVPTVGARLASVSLRDCREAAEAALARSDPTAARAAVRAVLDRRPDPGGPRGE